MPKQHRRRAKADGKTKPAERPLTAAPPLVIKSEGQRMFAEVPGTLTAIAEQVGVSVQTISNWRTGVHIPPPRWRGPVYSAFGIPEIAWSRRPGGSLEPPPLEGEADELDASASSGTLAEMKAIARTLKRDRLQEGLLPAERSKLAAEETRTLKQIAKLEQVAELSEARYVLEHPAWVRLRKTIVKALEPYPLAAKAIAEAINAMERVP